MDVFYLRQKIFRLLLIVGIRKMFEAFLIVRELLKRGERNISLKNLVIIINAIWTDKSELIKCLRGGLNDSP